MKVQSFYDNPNVEGKFNGGNNNNSVAEIYFKNVKYGPDPNKKEGLLVDLSGAILDASDKEYLPVYPESINLEIECGGAVKTICPKQQ